MATVTPCIRGKLGSITYYQTKMLARELIRVARAAKEHDDWANWGIEERMQREPEHKRIESEIAPYLANNPDRFFGSLIILVYNGDIYFEGLVNDFKAKIPKAYETQAQDIGFITIDGGDLIVLDGQHRLLALEKVVKRSINGATAHEVGDDEVSVIFIKHESVEKTRRIFNKVNKHAKKLKRGDELITSEDDGTAIITRKLLAEGAPLGVKDGEGEVIVNWTSNTLAPRSTKLTTISAVYETARIILDHYGIKNFDEKHTINRPSDDEIDKTYQYVQHYWSTLLNGLEPYREALSHVSNIPRMREDKAPNSLLFKPAAQIALCLGLMKAVDHGLTLEEAVERANDVDWSMSSPIWKNIIVNPNGTINAYAEARDRTSLMIAYLISADRMTEGQLEHFKSEYYRAWGYLEGDVEGIPPLPDPVAAAN